MIEIKTKSTLSTINDLEKHIAHDGSKFTVCNAGTRKFKDVVKEPAYRSQICQHAAATGIKNVLLVYSIPGGLIKKMVLVQLLSHHLSNLVNFQKWLQTKYLSQLYPVSNATKGYALNLVSLGRDYGEEYCYAIEHHSVDLWM